MAVVLWFQILSSSAISKPEYGESPDYSLLRDAKVLLADCNYVNRAVTRKMLEKLGCIVDVVSSGYDCLGALGAAVSGALGAVVSSFQIVLLDLHLPDLDGIEVTMRIQKFRSRSWPLIIGLAATADENVSAKCL